MTVKEIVEYIMNSKDEHTSKPTFLIHNVGGGHVAAPEIVEKVLADGLSANYGDWESNSKFVPNRPKGNFLWGEEKFLPESYSQVKVDVRELDTTKLWAFPSMAAWLADELAKGVEVVNGAVEALEQIHPVPYDDYNGEFHAEWIYTDDISPKILF